MPSMKIARLPISTADIEDLAITTAKLADLAVSTAKIADAAVTTAKVATGVMSSKIEGDHTSASYTLAAGEEVSLIGPISGNGSAVILFSGDGDGTFNMRVYIDGAMEEEFPTNEPRIGIYSFTTSIEVKLYNPTGASATATSSSCNLRGVAR